MPKVLDRIKQWGEGETKPQETQIVAGKKAYSNMMVYLKELKLHNIQNLELAEQIYQLSENSVEKLNEMHQVLTEKLRSPSDAKDAQELLKRTEFLQNQIGNLSVMLREVYEKQEAANGESSEASDQGITYEQFKEMQEMWKQFEHKMAVKFINQESQVKNSIHTEMSGYTDEVKHVIEEEMSAHAEDIKRTINESMSHSSEDVKRVVDEGASGIREGVKSAINEEMSTYMDEVKHAVDEGMSVHKDAVKQAVDTGIAGQSEVVSSAIKNEMYGFRTDIADAVRDEIAGYNDDVKAITAETKETFENALYNHELGIKKEITAVQEMLELTQRDQYNSVLDEINNVKKVVKGYTRIAMWASCLALIVLILDILILK